jgi:GT2 family glycosyltransferase
VSRLAVVTVAHGRPEHLAAQEETLASSSRPAEVRVHVAAARNRGARRALEQGADVLVFLDVDCLVAPGTLGAYDDAVRERPDVVWCGPVTYLRAADRPYPLHDLSPLDAPHPVRPAPAPGERLLDDRWELFWSLSFAVSAQAWERTGGFDEAYTGYGAEDTDLGQRARAAGLALGWLGDARAYHQHHPTQDPPVQHLADILRNGRLFRDRWGWWPMQGWLTGFERLGLVEQVGDDWRAR